MELQTIIEYLKEHVPEALVDKGEEAQTTQGADIDEKKEETLHSEL